MSLEVLVLGGSSVALGLGLVIGIVRMRLGRRAPRGRYAQQLPTWGGTYREILAHECMRPRRLRHAADAVGGPVDVTRARLERPERAASRKERDHVSALQAGSSPADSGRTR